MSDPDFSPPLKVFVTPKHRKQRKTSQSQDDDSLRLGLDVISPLEAPPAKKEYNFNKKKKNFTGYKCDQCSRRFKSKFEVKRHTDSVH